jgi:PAS domain S-box-containing protein
MNLPRRQAAWITTSGWQSIPKSNKIAWLVLLVGLLATGYAGYVVKSEIDLEAQHQLAFDCDEIRLMIEGRLLAHKQVLLGGAALFDASDSVTRPEWRAFAARVGIDQHFNGIQGLGVSLLIPKQQLAQHISDVRLQGFPEYIVRPAGEREVYSSIIYLEPFSDRNLRAFGYDMYSEPVRRAAMEQARDENIISLSGMVRLVQETDKDVQAGSLMYAPVYRKLMPIKTVEQRRAALYGWVYSPFRMTDLLHGVLKRVDNHQGRHLRLQVYDGSAANADSLLYESEAEQKATSSATVFFSLERRMNFNGHEWTLHLEQMKDSMFGGAYIQVWMAVAGGMSLSTLLFFLVLSYLNTRRNAARIADDMTIESRNSSRYARSLIEASLDPLFTISPDGKITDVNQGSINVTGVRREELIGADFSRYFTEPDKARIIYQQVYSKGFVTDYPLTIQHADGRLTDVMYNASVYKDETEKILGVFAAARDVTALKRIEVELIKSKEQLEEKVQLRTADLVLARDAAEAANRAKSVFLSSMSHELRTPLNAILGFSNLMRKNPQLQDEQRETLNIINRSGEHLLALINDVLEMAKIEAGRVQLESEPFDLGNLVRDVTDMMHVRAQEKGLQLLFDQSSEFPRYIKGDEARLRQVLINLVGNAIKFTEQGGVTVRLGTRNNHVSHLLIEVEDSGIGIAQEDQHHVFNPFVQLNAQGSNQGTGLGLTISRQFVELMGGSISLESTPGKGSLFRLDLSLEEIGSVEVNTVYGEEKGDVVGLVPGQPEYRILIVEDQFENQLLLTKLMENIGLPVRVAGNGLQGLELFQSWHPHLIWMDRRLPVMDGIEATRRIRELPDGHNVKIIAVTASAFMEQRTEMLEAGMDEFVRKPYRFNEIYECLGRQLGVQFTRSEVQSEDNVSDVFLTAEMLAVLPLELRLELHEAVESLRATRITAVIGQVAPYDSNLYKTLSHLADNFDYPAILKVLQTNQPVIVS